MNAITFKIGSAEQQIEVTNDFINAMIFWIKAVRPEFMQTTNAETGLVSNDPWPPISDDQLCQFMMMYSLNELQVNLAKLNKAIADIRYDEVMKNGGDLTAAVNAANARIEALIAR
jgi:hypothetical protein